MNPRTASAPLPADPNRTLEARGVNHCQFCGAPFQPDLSCRTTTYLCPRCAAEVRRIARSKLMRMLGRDPGRTH